MSRTTERDTARELTALVTRLRRRLREVAGLDELTPSQTAVLSRLDRHGPASTSDLARAERVRPQSMAAMVAALEERGLVGRQPDPTDGRRQVVTLAGPAGEQIAASRRARWDWLEAALRERYSAAERTTITEAVRLLDRLVDE